MSKSILIDNELLIKPTHGGVALIKPTNNVNSRLNKLDDVLKLPVNVYFHNTDSELQKVNETTVKNWNYLSAEDVVGRTLKEFASKESAAKAISDDNLVMESRQLQVNEEKFIRKDDTLIHAFSFKFPWLDNQNKIIGTFGFSIPIDSNNLLALANALNQIIRMGLFNTVDNKALKLIYGSNYESNIITSKNINNEKIHLTNRELQCLQFTIRGHSAKVIANLLGLSKRTVEEYINNMKDKFKVSSKGALINAALDYFDNL